MDDSQQVDIRKLCKSVEQYLEHTMETPKDFSFLAKKVHNDLGEALSATTLKRLWGYLHENVTPHSSTLSILSRLIGFHSFQEFCDSLNNQQNERAIKTRGISIDDLNVGDEVEFIWFPSSLVRCKYLGATGFEVLKANGTMLQKGDIFNCCAFYDREQLILSNIVSKRAPSTLSVGSSSGIRLRDQEPKEKK